MDGLLIIDKPAGMTSHDVVARVRRIFKTKRVGHTGTLDPFATGVLVLLIGKATRLAPFVDKDEKEYEATIQFGWETDTGDLSGAPSNAERGTRNAEFDVEQVLASVDWESVFSKFRGNILQTPPMYSAKKIAGKKLYELARDGIIVEREPVAVTIHKLQLLPDKIRIPHSSFRIGEGFEIRISVACSAGTYIRTLAQDIGRDIGVGAHLTELRRTRAGRFSLNDAIAIEQLESLADPSVALRSPAQAVEHLRAVMLAPDRIVKAKDGLSTRIEQNGLADGESVRILDESANLIAIGIFNAEEKSVKPKIVLV